MIAKTVILLHLINYYFVATFSSPQYLHTKKNEIGIIHSKND